MKSKHFRLNNENYIDEHGAQDMMSAGIRFIENIYRIRK
jgi:hypothetical protein